MLAVTADDESAWLVSEWGRRNGVRFDAEHIEKFACAEYLGDAMCTERQHPTPKILFLVGRAHGSKPYGAGSR
jgi:hypothetical protein